MEQAETYKQILGVRTKGGFPTIVFKEFIDLEQIEGANRFYDKKTGDYLVVKDRIVYLWNDGQTDLDDFIELVDTSTRAKGRMIGMGEPRKEKWKKVNGDFEFFAVTRNLSGKIVYKLPWKTHQELERKNKLDAEQKFNEARNEEPKPFVGKDGIYVPIFDTTMEKSKLDDFKKTMKEMGIEPMEQEDIDEFIRSMDGATR